MAWFNSDDLLAPRALAFVAAYFAANPDVDVVYGHRIIIDDADREVGRWIMPRHEEDSIEWIDYVPQETLFWRKRAWDLAGGIDPSFQFALDWDLLARFQQAGCKIVRLPYFLGCFRVHSQQKTMPGHPHDRRRRNGPHPLRASTAPKGQCGERSSAMPGGSVSAGALTARLHAAGIRR